MHKILLQTLIARANTGQANMAKIRTNKQEVWKWYNQKKNSSLKTKNREKWTWNISTHNLHYTTGHFAGDGNGFLILHFGYNVDMMCPLNFGLCAVQNTTYYFMLLQVNNQFHFPWLKYAAPLLLKQSMFACQLVSPRLPAFMDTLPCLFVQNISNWENNNTSGVLHYT